MDPRASNRRERNIVIIGCGAFLFLIYFYVFAASSASVKNGSLKGVSFTKHESQNNNHAQGEVSRPWASKQDVYGASAAAPKHSEVEQSTSLQTEAKPRAQFIEQPFVITLDMTKEVQQFWDTAADRNTRKVKFSVEAGSGSSSQELVGDFSLWGLGSFSTKNTGRRSVLVSLTGDAKLNLADGAASQSFMLLSLFEDEFRLKYCSSLELLRQQGLWHGSAMYIRLRYATEGGDTREGGVYLLLQDPVESLAEAFGSNVDVGMREGKPSANIPRERLRGFPGNTKDTPLSGRFSKALDAAAAKNDAELTKYIDFDMYATWLGINSLLENGDYIAEVYFFGRKDDNMLRIMAWDYDSIQKACHAGGKSIRAQHKLLFCAESELDAAILASSNLWSQYMTALAAVLSRVSPDAYGKLVDATLAELGMYIGENAVDAASSAAVLAATFDTPKSTKSWKAISEAAGSMSTRLKGRWETLAAGLSEKGVQVDVEPQAQTQQEGSPSEKTEGGGSFRADGPTPPPAVEGGGAAVAMDGAELQLLAVWEKGMAGAYEKVLADIEAAADKTVLGVWEVEWSAGLFKENLMRFYLKSESWMSSKMDRCGTGPFRAIVVADYAPVYETRKTGDGTRPANVFFFDAKQKWRTAAGNGKYVDAVHTTVTRAEAKHDIPLLLGPAMYRDLLAAAAEEQVWTGEVAKHAHDLVGAGGKWDSFSDMFDVLNACDQFSYAVLRNWDPLPETKDIGSHTDVDCLAGPDSKGLDNFRTTLGLKATSSSSDRSGMMVTIDGTKVKIDYRYVGDDYYEKKWEQDILKSRQLTRAGEYVTDRTWEDAESVELPIGLFAPAPEQYFYSLLYHALIQKKSIAGDYKERMPSIAERAGVEGFASEAGSRASWKPYLDGWMKSQGYHYVRAKDKGVHFNIDAGDEGGP